MAAVCWTCRSAVQQVIKVFNLALDKVDCPFCMQSTSQVCVAVPCGHPVCAECARGWAARLNTWVQVPGGPVAPALVEDEQAEVRRRWWREFGQEVASDEESAVTVEEDGPEVAEEALVEEEAAVDDEVEDGARLRPPPWAVAPPQGLPAAPAVAPLLPAIGEAFEFHGRAVIWARLWQFGACIVLVYQDTGHLCKDGCHGDEPAAVPGWVVRWHRASNTDNKKWILCSWLDV